SRDLGGREALPALMRGHPLLGLVGDDPLVELAFIGAARNDRSASRRRGTRRVATVVQSELTLTLLGVWAVAFEAFLRQDRPDLAGEGDGFRRGWATGAGIGRPLRIRRQSGGSRRCPGEGDRGENEAASSISDRRSPRSDSGAFSGRKHSGDNLGSPDSR